MGDIAVEEGVGGCAQLYRLLQSYPPSRLRIVEGNLWPSILERRLPDVDYGELKVGNERLMRSRITTLYTAYLHARSATRVNELVQVAENFRAEAILTVAHGFSWETAAAVAERCNLPLHLIVHDDWPTLSPVPEILRGWLHRRFGEVYRRAQARFCISPFMVEEYASRYGVKGAVLYPLRARQQFTFNPITDQSEGRLESPVFAYVGAIHGGYDKPLRLLAGVLEEFNGQLVIYGELNEAAIEKLGLNKKNVTIKPHMPMGRLSRVLREEADVAQMGLERPLGVTAIHELLELRRRALEDAQRRGADHQTRNLRARPHGRRNRVAGER